MAKKPLEQLGEYAESLARKKPTPAQAALSKYMADHFSSQFNQYQREGTLLQRAMGKLAFKPIHQPHPHDQVSYPIATYVPRKKTDG